MRLPVFGLAVAIQYGSDPREYADGELVEVTANALTSAVTQLSRDYYSLPFCRPRQVFRRVLNLGEILQGELISNTPYEVLMRVEKRCEVLCRRKLGREEKQAIVSMIDAKYAVNLMVDKLPAATVYRIQTCDDDLREFSCSQNLTWPSGFQVGVKVDDRYLIHNHLRFSVRYHSSLSFEGSRIVGVEIEPMSMGSTSQRALCGGEFFEDDARGDSEGLGYVEAQEIGEDGPNQVTFTYSVKWVASERPWASRWDAYRSLVQDPPGESHWLAFFNSVFLSGVMATILCRTLRRDIERYNEGPSAEEAGQDEGGSTQESGWKAVQDDVFHPPPFPELFAVLVGTGAWVAAASLATVGLAALGLLRASSGSLLLSGVLAAALTSAVGAQVAARFGRLFGKRPDRAALGTAVAFPALIFASFGVLNAVLWRNGATQALPLSSGFALLVLWALALALAVGCERARAAAAERWGARWARGELHVPRPRPRMAVSPAPQCCAPACNFAALLCCGVLPFAAVLPELFWVLHTDWESAFYHFYGFLLLEMLVLIVNCAEMAIAVIHHYLAKEDARWWWRAWLAPASSGAYFFAYAAVFYRTQLMRRPGPRPWATPLLFFSRMALAAAALALFTGAIGALAGFFFVRLICGAVEEERCRIAPSREPDGTPAREPEDTPTRVPEDTPPREPEATDNSWTSV